MSFESTAPPPTSQDVAAASADRTTGKKYDAFISYSHAMDGKVAEAVQAGLHRLARPWRALRALRAFRDTTTLSANPALWESITAALDESRFFILLAGPEAASSSWVSREVEYWSAKNGFDRLLVVVTDGELVWDAGAGRVDKARTTSLPLALEDTLTSEPRFVDLRWARSDEMLSLRDPRFREAIADLAAPLHGVSKDELVGEDVRQHTRTQRITRAAVALLALLLTVAVIAAVVAIGQRNRAQTQAALATSRYLAAQSLAESDAHPSRGLLLASYGLKLTDTTEARGAMLSNLWQRPQLLKILEDHADPAWAISKLVYSPDGRRLAVASRDGTVVLWDVVRGRQIGRPLGGVHNAKALAPQAILSIAYQPQGARVASGNGSGEITIWDATTGRKIARGEYGAPVSSLAYSPNGAFLAAGFQDHSGTVALFHLGSDKRPRFFRLGTPVFSVAFSRNGKRLAMGDARGNIMLWNLADPLSTPRHLAGGDAAQELEFSRGDKLLACACGNAGIRLWPVEGAETAGKTLGRGPYTYGVAFSRDGKTLASSGDNGYVRLWDLATFRQKTSPLLASWKHSVLTVAFSPLTDTLASGSGDGQLLLWSERARRPLGTSIFARGPEAAVAAVSGDGHLLVVATSRGAALWDDETGREIGPLPSLRGHATSAAFNASGTSVLVGYDKGEVAVYDVKTRRLVNRGRPMSTGSSVGSVAFSADGTVIIATDAVFDHVDLWDARTGASIGRPINAGAAIDDLATNPRINIAATADFDQTVRLWDMRTGKPRGRVTGHNDSVLSVSFSRDGRFLASAGLEGTVIVTDVKTGRTMSTLPITGVRKVALDATGKTLAAATDNTIQLWDVATAREIGPPLTLGGRVNALSFTHDGDLLTALATNPPEITRWNFDARTEIQTACAIANRDLTDRERNQFIGLGFSGTAPCRAP